MKIVQFKNGKYGIQKGNKLYRVLTGIFGINTFYDLDNLKIVWHRPQLVAENCQTKFEDIVHSQFKAFQDELSKPNPAEIHKEIEYKNQDL